MMPTFRTSAWVPALLVVGAVSCNIDQRDPSLAGGVSVSTNASPGDGGSVTPPSVEETDDVGPPTVGEGEGGGPRSDLNDRLVENAEGANDAGADISPSVVAGQVVFQLVRSGDGFGQITLAIPGGDVLRCDSGCQATVASGSMVRVTAAPGAYSVVRAWSEPDCVALETCELRVDQSRTLDVELQLGYNVAFVTSQVYTVDALPRAGEPANQECARLAASAGLHGSRWVAWLAADGATTAPEDDIVPYQFFQSRGGWVRPDGVPFVASLDALRAGAVLHAMNVTEHRAVTRNSAWSAARLDGTLRRITLSDGDDVAIDCASWTSVDPTLSGSVSTPSGVGNAWTGETIQTCDGRAALHCFGDDPAPELSIVPTPGRLAFLSSSTFTPSSGILAADELCQRDACEAGLTGSNDCNISLGTQRIFRSYLHTQTQPAWERFDLTGPTWVRPDGIAWLTSAAHLAGDASARLTGLNVTATLQYVVTGAGLAWLGASSGEETCSDWTSETDMGRTTRFKDASTGSTLTQVGGVFFTCDAPAQLLCLQD
jgi:hypothetical protein